MKVMAVRWRRKLGVRLSELAFNLSKWTMETSEQHVKR